LGPSDRTTVRIIVIFCINSASWRKKWSRILFTSSLLKLLTGVEIRVLKKIFSLEEAGLASRLTGKFEQVNAIIQRNDLTADETKKLLFEMLRRGLVWYEKKDGKRCFRLAPFIVGLYEAQLELMDHELAHLVEEYMANGGAAGIMKPEPALHRVLPAQDTVKTEWILPYEDVCAILMSAKTFHVRDCICRVEQEYLGRKCEFPVHMCLSFSNIERPSQEGDISREEALALLNRSEEVGLVHTVSNVMQDIGYVCNCCSCCCGILRGITDFGILNSVAYANYYAVIDPELCVGCGDCIERCQVHAIHGMDGVSAVDRERCIGCGLCVTGCPNEVARLERKPEAERIQPPVDFAAWEHERLVNRGLGALES
jgi:electron transport complex protein RnfB